MAASWWGPPRSWTTPLTQTCNCTSKDSAESAARARGLQRAPTGLGLIPASLSGEIIAINEAVTASPTLVNSDPHGQGWIVKLGPSNLEGEKADLVTGQAAVEAFQALMTDRGISCH